MYLVVVISLVLGINVVKGQDACTTAQLAVAGDSTCQQALLGLTANVSFDANSSLCSDPCYSLVNGVINSCPQFSAIGLLLIVLCDGNSSTCIGALTQIQNDPICAAQVQSMSTAACTGACRTLVDNAVTSCAGQSGAITQADVDQVCGGINEMKGFDLSVLLLITLAVIIF